MLNSVVTTHIANASCQRILDTYPCQARRGYLLSPNFVPLVPTIASLPATRITRHNATHIYLHSRSDPQSTSDSIFGTCLAEDSTFCLNSIQ